MSDIFQKTLQDLIKGIRSQKRDPASFVSQAILEIKNELKSVDPFTKTEAVTLLLNTRLSVILFN
jgi:AP-3 complex subunit delta-1